MHPEGTSYKSRTGSVTGSRTAADHVALNRQRSEYPHYWKALKVLTVRSLYGLKVVFIP